MIKSLLLIASCSVLSGACQTQYAEDPHTLLDITLHDGSTAQFLAVADRAADKHGLAVDRGVFEKAGYRMYALRLEGREFAVSISNPHRPQEFVIATYLVATTGARTSSSERLFMGELVDEMVSQDLGRVSTRPRSP